MMVISKIPIFDKLFAETSTKNLKIVHGIKTEYYEANHEFDIKLNNLYRNLKEILRDPDNK